MFKYYFINFGYNYFIILLLIRLDSFNIISYIFGMLSVFISRIVYNKLFYENIK